ncbi:nucleolar and coiled-body phosphoprotein 1-like [Manduca sexta]|uniref:nucleolar and coiled-body phosphoprotein 1-like n=1 Tax=Manduca sexta TaxID=7130 RepID=UPI00188E9715|nr:nucleolar and coiled-body phosphoprotein 1-like [Manduca sexta]
MGGGSLSSAVAVADRNPLPPPAVDSVVGEAEIGERKPNQEGKKECMGVKPMELEDEFAHPRDIDSESSGSVASVRSQRLWRRHARSKDSCSVLTSETDEPAPKAVTTDGRGRGRPPSTGKYVGLRKAQMERDKLKREEARQKAEEELEERLRFVKSPMPPKAADLDEDRPILKEDLRQCSQKVRSVLRKSGNLKSTSRQPESAAMARLEGEARKWRERSARLEDSVKRLEEENATLRRRLEDLEASAAKTSTEEMLAMVEARVQARMESLLMGPAQRPPLAHEKKSTPGDIQLPVTGGVVGGAAQLNPTKGKGMRKGKRVAQIPTPIPALVAEPPSAPTQTIAGPSTASATTSATPTGKQKKKAPAKKMAPARKGRETTNDSEVQATPDPRPLPPAPATMETPWVVVASRKAKKPIPAAAPTANPQSRQPARRAEPKLRPPRSAAVIISLTPAAVAKGLSYKGVLMDAQSRVDLTGLDITRLRPKFTATGAPMYEVPGANSEERADSLAARLRECFGGSEDVKISRPTKTVELRLTELDYTATPESVAAALSKAGECPTEAIKVGQIRPDRSGVGTAWVKMPIKAALKVKGAGRILIGWTAARVTVLETRPMRCFRCLEPGHVRECCDCSVDRSELCYRCGQTGHKARECKAAPNCVICAASGKPAGHRLGGKACTASSRRNRRRPRSQRRIVAVTAEAPTQPQAASPPLRLTEMDVEEIAQQ